jgi:hypothetical protein
MQHGAIIRLMRARLVLLACAGVPVFGQKPELFPNPAGTGNLQPNWSTTQDGSAVLSWIEPLKDGSYSLRYAIRRETAWYTGANDSPKVRVIFSDDGGLTFSYPSVVRTGHALGYTSAVLNENGSATVFWLETKGGGAARFLGRTITAGGTSSPGGELRVARGRR